MPMVERNESEAKQWDYQEHGEPTHIVDCVTLAATTHEVINDAPVSTEAVIKKSLADRRNTKQTVKNLAPELSF